MIAAAPLRTPVQRHRRGRMLWPVMLAVAFVMLSVAFVTYILWPRWPGSAADVDAPALPITVGGTTFNVPPRAIRVAVQRRPGTQARIDLAFVWPTLQPPDARGASSTDATAPSPADRIFVTIANGETTMAPADRLRTIYPRYYETTPTASNTGLLVLPFRSGTPYQGEDLIYDDAHAPRFVARCTRNSGLIPGECLAERRIGSADVTARFPRDWLSDWRAVADAIDRLIGNLRAPGS